MGREVSSPPAHEPLGRRTTRLVLLRLMTRFPRTITTWLVSTLIIVKLRATNRYVKLTLVRSCPNSLNIPVRIDMLNVEAGLLVTSSDGPNVKLCVKDVSRCRLLDSLRGKWPTQVCGSRITLSRLFIQPPVLVMELHPRRMSSGLVIPLVTATSGPNEEFGLRNMKLTLVCPGPKLCLPMLPTLTLSMPRELLDIPRRLVTVWLAADPLELDLFIRFSILEWRTAKPVLLMVPKLGRTRRFGHATARPPVLMVTGRLC